MCFFYNSKKNYTRINHFFYQIYFQYKNAKSAEVKFKFTFTETRKISTIPLFTLAPKGTPVKIPGMKIRYFYGYEILYFISRFEVYKKNKTKNGKSS